MNLPPNAKTNKSRQTLFFRVCCVSSAKEDWRVNLKTCRGNPAAEACEGASVSVDLVNNDDRRPAVANPQDNLLPVGKAIFFGLKIRNVRWIHFYPPARGSVPTCVSTPRRPSPFRLQF